MLRAPYSEPSARRVPQPAIIFFAATFALLAIVGRRQMFNDPGTFWHLLTGERVLRQGLPYEDWLTFTFAGKPWIAHQWLAECVMAVLRRLGGYDALLVAATGALALLFTWMFRRLLAATVQLRWAVLLTALAVMTSAGSMHVRPLLASMVFFAWTFARLVDVEAGRARIRDLAWLLPLLVVWVNSHGAALGGIATFCLVAALWLGAWAAGRPSPVEDRVQALALAALALAAMLTPLANPYGLELVRTWLAIVRSPAVAELIIEHGSVWRTRTWYVVPFAAVYFVVYLGAADRRWRATSLLSLVWLILMFQRVRHAPLFASAALLALPELLPHCRAVAWLAQRRIDVCGGPAVSAQPPRFLWVIPLAFLSITAGTYQLSGHDLSGPRLGPWPFELKGSIEASSREVGKGAPVINDMALGGFLAHEFPDLRIFADDRCELYGDDFLREWFRGDRAWYAGWVARYDIKLAVAEHGTTLDDYLRATPAWREVSSVPSATLFVRDGALQPAGR